VAATGTSRTYSARSLDFPALQIGYFGLPPRHDEGSGYAKWFFLTYRILREKYRIRAAFLGWNPQLVDAYLTRIPLLGSLYVASLLAPMIRVERPVLHVLSQGMGFYRLLDVAKGLSQGGAVTIMTVHDIEDSTGSVRMEIGRKIQSADALFVPSQSTYRALLSHFHYEGPIHVIPNPIDHSVFRALPREEREDCRRRVRRLLGLREEDKVLLFVGSELPRKNVKTLIYVLSRCHRRIRDLKLLLVSRPTPQRPSLVRTAKLAGVENQVRWINHVTDHELAELYNAADAFVTLSMSEGFGIPAAESMACGTPVIASNVSALPEVVGTAGILVNPSDVDSVADILCDLLDSPSTAEALSIAGIKRANEFQPERIAAMYVDAYSALLAGKTNLLQPD